MGVLKTGKICFLVMFSCVILAKAEIGEDAKETKEVTFPKEESQIDKQFNPHFEISWILEKLSMNLKTAKGDEISKTLLQMKNGLLVNFFRDVENSAVFDELFDGWNNTTIKSTVEKEIDDALENKLKDIPNTPILEIRDIIKFEGIKRRYSAWYLVTEAIDPIREMFGLEPEVTAANDQEEIMKEEMLYEELYELQFLIQNEPFDLEIERSWIVRKTKKNLRDTNGLDESHAIKMDELLNFLESKDNKLVFHTLFTKLQNATTKFEIDSIIKSAVENELESLPNFWLLSNEDLVKLLYMKKYYDSEQLDSTIVLLNSLAPEHKESFIGEKVFSTEYKPKGAAASQYEKTKTVRKYDEL